MSIAHSPLRFSRRVRKFLRNQVIRKISFLNAYYEKREVDAIYALAKIDASHSFPLKVLGAGWATQDCLRTKNYRTLISKLARICQSVGAFEEGGIPSALHWSRQYEYPYAILNGVPRGKLPKDCKILDCGAGIGPVQFYLAMKGFEVYSLDLNLRALERVARFGLENGLINLHPNYGSLLKLPFPNSYFDSVLNISVVEHVVYNLNRDTTVILKGLVNELLRVLKPGGVVVLTFDVNLNPQRSNLRLHIHEYETLCKILGISSTPPPINRLSSSDTKEGQIMGEGLCTFCTTFSRDQ